MSAKLARTGNNNDNNSTIFGKLLFSAERRDQTGLTCVEYFSIEVCRVINLFRNFGRCEWGQTTLGQISCNHITYEKKI